MQGVLHFVCELGELIAEGSRKRNLNQLKKTKLESSFISRLVARLFG